MDIGQLHDVTTALGSAGKLLPVLASLAAGLSTIGLLSGVARLQRKTLPVDFPGDPEALQLKYAMAFKQLSDEATQDLEALADKDQGGIQQRALVLATNAFAKARLPVK